MNSLLDKINKIEALIAGGKTDGEKKAAIAARDRHGKKIVQKVVLTEYTLYTPDNWHKRYC